MIVNGFFVSKKKMGDSELAKEKSEWDIDDIKMTQLNIKAICILCDNANVVSNQLEITHTNKNQTMETRLECSHLTMRYSR